MNQVRIMVNGEAVEAVVEPRTQLADFLRDQLRLTGTHVGCEHGVCGACTVLINEEPARSCITYAVMCDGHDVRTIEGFDGDEIMADLRQAFSREHALQCGFCTPAMLIAARDLVLRIPDADEQRIRVEMSGNLCRCTGYLGIVRAIKSVIQARGSSRAVVLAAPVPVQRPVMPFTAFTVADAALNLPQASQRQPGNRIEEAFLVEHRLEDVWSVLGDMPAVAACLPGAEIIEHTPSSVRGKVIVKMGPMRASFEGAASLRREDATRTGIIRGGGTDNLSGSRARGDIRYQLSSEEGNRTRVKLAIEYALQGPLAQFSRAGLVNAFVAALTADFAKNLNSRLAEKKTDKIGRPTPVAHVDAGRFFFKWLWLRVKAQFAFKKR